ncbi:hypothetical protein HFC70_24325 [Agrobacterium sp. a22-2]|uniref:hypothetical protein n=1 Tax=Agrobacterium sp. a22-2 TaxID=2283840 RepID=UPI001444F7A9|nr:hypothetical protein [Agrobacterium sp. a22-2]NKN39478.1 hypothetical protein [Agrobacterium sp. a22-2]
MGDQKMRESRSPASDKAASLKLDCRDDYGENNKSRRKNIPLFKAQSNRRARHSAKVAVEQTIESSGDVTDAKLANADKKALHPFKTKHSDRPLGECLELRKKR